MIENKAKELGRLIGQSPEYQAVRRANDVNRTLRSISTFFAI